MTKRIKIIETGNTTTAIKVICQLIVSIIIKIPTRVTTLEISVDKDWLSDCAIVSISLVTRERISPLVCLSK